MKKLYWEIRNNLEIALQTLLQTFSGKKGGALSHKIDSNDEKYIYEEEESEDSKKSIGASLQEVFSRFKYYYNQAPFNTCIFASGAIAFGEQCGIKWSARWLIKVGRHLGLLKGNGWSYLRAMGKIATTIGFIPYSMMPDEVNGMSWEEYSKWTPDDERLLKVAEKYKCKKYRWIRSREALINAIQNGYVPLTASKWFGEMNTPKAPLYILFYLGRYIGGHAYRYTGWSHFGKYIEAPQSYSRSYGKDTKAWMRDPFHPKNQFSIYILSKLPIELLVDEFKKSYEGWVVRTKDNVKCFYIQDGKKRHIPTADFFQEIRDKIGREKYDGLILQKVLDKIPEGSDILQLN